jgi:hypothetical protein
VQALLARKAAGGDVADLEAAIDTPTPKLIYAYCHLLRFLLKQRTKGSSLSLYHWMNPLFLQILNWLS